MHKIVWKKQAINDLIKIGQFIAKESPIAADKIVTLIEDKVKPLAAHPEIGRAGRKRGTREIVAHTHYVVIYRVLKTTIVEILRIKHTSQQWP